MQTYSVKRKHNAYCEFRALDTLGYNPVYPSYKFILVGVKKDDYICYVLERDYFILIDSIFFELALSSKEDTCKIWSNR